MPIVKAFDFIKTAADKAYLARCTCQGDVCQCSHDDGHTLFHTLNASSNNKGIEMTILDKMSAADRKELASKIEAAAEQMTPAERRDLIETLSAPHLAAILRRSKQPNVKPKFWKIFKRLAPTQSEPASGSMTTCKPTCAPRASLNPSPNWCGRQNKKSTRSLRLARHALRLACLPRSCVGYRRSRGPCFEGHGPRTSFQEFGIELVL